MGVLTIQDAIKEALADDGISTKYEAGVLRELILADDYLSEEERKHLQDAIDDDSLDAAAFEILSLLLFRDSC